MQHVPSDLHHKIIGLVADKTGTKEYFSFGATVGYNVCGQVQRPCLYAVKMQLHTMVSVWFQRYWEMQLQEKGAHPLSLLYLGA